jgi:hypothetical protein
MPNQTESQFRSILETVSKAGAVLLATVYAAGFLIVVLHHAQYGIAEFNPLKPKIFSAGILFILLFAVPAIAAYRFYAPSTKADDANPEQPKKPAWTILTRIFDFYLFSFTLAQPWMFLFGRSGSELLERVPWWAILTVFVLLVGVIFIGRRLGKNKPAVALGLSVFLAAVFFTGELRYGERATFWLALWFYVIGVGTILFRRGLVELEKIKKLEWERLAPTFLIFPLSIYATQVYGKIKPPYGGGMPTPVTLHFSGKNPLSEHDDEGRFLLIDETDHGYYLLKNAQEKKSYFIRRDAVVVVVLETAE